MAGVGELAVDAPDLRGVETGTDRRAAGRLVGRPRAEARARAGIHGAAGGAVIVNGTLTLFEMTSRAAAGTTAGAVPFTT